jgi:hypothetical protein
VPLDNAAVLSEIDDVLREAAAFPLRENSDYAGPISALSAAINRDAPAESYRQQAEAMMRPTGGSILVGRLTYDKLVSVLHAVRADLAAGRIRTLEDRVRDDLSNDLLDTAESIVKLHAAPAIVLAASLLEEHVRKMCAARGIDTLKSNGSHRSFEDMTAELQRDDAITSTERRTMTAWYAQRTEAAHGRFDNVTADEAPRLIAGVRDFMVRHPH